MYSSGSQPSRPEMLCSTSKQEWPRPSHSAGHAHAGPDLDCLDHSYFLAEVTRLLGRASSTYDRLVRDACSTRGRAAGGGDSAQLVAGAQQVLALLQSHQ